jgi:16S rRNA G966 N2-methylase RsmD
MYGRGGYLAERKHKLELTWIGKENRPRLEPRILLEEPERSYHAKHRVKDADIFDNRLIFGDNLLALKALEAEFTGKVKCIYIDPPFNTQQALEFYEDGIESLTMVNFDARSASYSAESPSQGWLNIHSHR